MMDTRKFTKEAEKLSKSGKPIILRMKLPNGDIAERLLTPALTSNNTDQIYINKKGIYKLKDTCKLSMDITKLDNQMDMMLHYIENLPYSKVSDGTLMTLLETLLVSGYVVCKND